MEEINKLVYYTHKFLRENYQGKKEIESAAKTDHFLKTLYKLNPEVKNTYIDIISDLEKNKYLLTYKSLFKHLQKTYPNEILKISMTRVVEECMQ